MIVSPIYLELPRKKSANKKIALNMNSYRNMHYHISNQCKAHYKEIMREQIQAITRLTWPVKIKYNYYLKIKSDVSNIHAVVDKYFCDALVELGRLPDDNINYIVGASYMFAGYDRKNPRCEIEILENYQM